jgi:hypothetical protein
LRNDAGRQLVSILPAGFSSRAIMQSCPVLPVIGTITAVGASSLDKGGVVYRYLEICEQGGRTQRVASVRAIKGLAGLIERHAVGMFLFSQGQGEHRLWGVDRADGPQRVDFEALRAYVKQRGEPDAA